MSEDSESLRRHRRGPQPLVQDMSGLMARYLASRGFGEADLVTRWPAIVGASLAAHCLPQKLTAKGEDGALLTLLADDRAALELQHQAPKLIDKINTYFGRPVVKKLKIVAGEIPQAAKPPPAPRPLTTAEEQRLAEATGGIEDPGLKSALERLGRQALGRSRRR